MWIEILLTIGSAWSFLAVKALITNSQQLCPLCRVPIKVTQLARRALIYFHVVKFMSGVSHWVPIGYFPTRSLPSGKKAGLINPPGTRQTWVRYSVRDVEDRRDGIEDSGVRDQVHWFHLFITIHYAELYWGPPVRQFLLKASAPYLDSEASWLRVVTQWADESLLCDTAICFWSIVLWHWCRAIVKWLTLVWMFV